MKNTLGDFMAAGVFSPGDLDRMQRAYDTARARAGVAAEEADRMRAMALAVLSAHQSGERDEQALVERALEVDRGGGGPGRAPTARLG